MRYAHACSRPATPIDVRARPQLEADERPDPLGVIARSGFVLAAAARTLRSGRVQPRCRLRGSRRMSRAQPIICSWNQRRSGTPNPRLGRSSTAGGTHGRITSRNRRFSVDAVAVPRRRLHRRQLDDAVIENRAPRLERMRHRRAIDFHENVVGQVVMLVPLLQARQQRAVRARGCRRPPAARGALRRRAARPARRPTSSR